MVRDSSALHPRPRTAQKSKAELGATGRKRSATEPNSLQIRLSLTGGRELERGSLSARRANRRANRRIDFEAKSGPPRPSSDASIRTKRFPEGEPERHPVISSAPPLQIEIGAGALDRRPSKYPEQFHRREAPPSKLGANNRSGVRRTAL
ncbi:hypothetical protein KM043_001411 [Ampulex compressa]|nr:hypothetical protein KM043_001411 [Ampulex compressa]